MWEYAFTQVCIRALYVLKLTLVNLLYVSGLAVLFKPVSFFHRYHNISTGKYQAFTWSIFIEVMTVRWPAWEPEHTDEDF